jgi:hypothetical protein
LPISLSCRSQWPHDESLGQSIHDEFGDEEAATDASDNGATSTRAWSARPPELTVANPQTRLSPLMKRKGGAAVLANKDWRSTDHNAMELGD